MYLEAEVKKEPARRRLVVDLWWTCGFVAERVPGEGRRQRRSWAV